MRYSHDRLDVARETYRENLNDVNDLQDGLRTRLSLNLTLVNTAKGEFLLQCSKEDWAETDRDVQRQFTSIVSFVSVSVGSELHLIKICSPFVTE